MEAQMKKLQDEKILAESTLATAKTEKESAVTALSNALVAMDDLDSTVKAAAEPTAKVEAIRKKLAEKPGAAATASTTRSDQNRKKIEGADEVTDYVKKVV